MKKDIYLLILLILVIIITTFSNRKFLVKYLKFLIGSFSKKGKLEYKLIEENEMGLVYNVFLPANETPDVVKRTLKVSVDGVDKLVEVEPSVSLVTLDPIKDNSSVVLTLQDTDDAGNVSEWSEPLSFTALDTIVPSAPGKISVKLISEVADPAPAPEPAPEPAPAPVVEGDAVVAPVVVDSVSPATPAPVEAVLDSETPTEEVIAPLAEPPPAEELR